MGLCLFTLHRSLFAYSIQIFGRLPCTDLCSLILNTSVYAYPVRIVPRGYLDEYDGVGVHVGGGGDAAEK